MAKDPILKITDSIQMAIDNLQKSIPAVQNGIASEIELLLRSLELKGDRIANTITNLKVIGQIQSKINNIVLSPAYIKAVKEFTDAFNEIAARLNDYFRLVSPDFRPTDVLNEIKRQSIESVVRGLTEDGLRANISGKLTDILRQNITTGASYMDLRNQLADYIKTNSSGTGALQKYVTQLTTDALNQFNGQYMASVTQSLDLQWHMYVGSNLTSTRPFCDLLTKKKYIFEPELKEILKGNIDGQHVHINDKTDLPDGMIPGTNANNFQVYRGGYNCGHQYVPVAEQFVPLDVRLAAYAKYGISHDSKGMRTAA